MSEPVSFFGWVQNPAEVERVMKGLAVPLFGAAAPSLDENKDVYLWETVRKVLNQDAPKGPQKIGDCVSWGWSNLVNYVQCVEIYKQLHSKNLLQLPDKDLFQGTLLDYNNLVDDRQAILEEYQETATEVIYALSRVEVGGQRGSYSDGSVGAWAAEAVTKWGTLSRKYLESKGLGGAYDPNRAKKWGAQGLPDNLEPDAKQHLIKTVSQVKSFREAAAAIQNGYPVAVCSNQGFTMTRDGQGFCRPQGTWAHCMLFVGVRWDRPGLCCSQSWGPNTPDGPRDKDQPDNTFWVDDKTCDRMLSQDDSFTGSQFDGYPAQDLIHWDH